MLRQIRRTVVRTVAAGTVVVGTVEVATHLPSQGRSSLFYHSLCDDYITPCMRRFLDPETAHSLAIEFAKRGWSPEHHHYADFGVDLSIKPFGSSSSSVNFNNCIGLAAGFDKDGVVIQPMLDLGFGFVEIGSVTPLPQEGNPKPRMYRLVQDLGIVNRYGFNSAGIDEVKSNLERYRQGPDDSLDESSSSQESSDTAEAETKTIAQQVGVVLYKTGATLCKAVVALIASAGSRTSEQGRGVVGVNLGKNKETQDEIADYKVGIQELGPLADYLVINVSSPNTPGLRDLQQPDSLARILKAAVQARDELPTRPPLLIKLEPDMNDQQLQEAVKTIMECQGVDGIIVTNTSLSRPDTILSEHKGQSGGLSGAPIRDMSTECIRKVYRYTQGSIPIVGVGGVGSGHDAYEKIRAGASLVQVYSMMVYQGPGVVSRIRQELSQLMVQNGQRRIQDVVGLDHEAIYWKKRQERLLKTERELRRQQGSHPPSLLQSISGSPSTAANESPLVWDEETVTYKTPQKTTKSQESSQNSGDSNETEQQHDTPLPSVLTDTTATTSTDMTVSEE